MRPTEDGWDEKSAARAARLAVEDAAVDALREKWLGWTIGRCDGGWLAMHRRSGEQAEAFTPAELDAVLAFRAGSAPR